MDLSDIGVKTALIVDDGVDPSPLVSDLGAVGDDWSVFWADLSEADTELLARIYPEYTDIDAEELSQDQAFVTLMFENRSAFSNAALDKVFETFLGNQRQVRQFIDVASGKLETIGLQVTEVGRDFEGSAIETDLIILDLFLGSSQANKDKERSIYGLKGVLKNRPDNPPMVLLTSAHNDLHTLRHEFRDDTGLLASGFRTIKKSEIHEDGRLEQLVFELAEHRDDALKLWAFLQSWDAGISNALKRAKKEVRKLDLEDLSHVKRMLSTEGVPLGGYMVDIMDAVLAHELEADQGVIDAAANLNSLQATSYPPNSITGNKNTLEVVRKTLFVHNNRQQLDPSEGFPVSLGDIIAIPAEADRDEVRKNTIFESEERRVFLVLTPACDLIRENPKAKRVLLLAGAYHDQGALNLRAAMRGEYTPALDLGAGQRGVVTWDLKHIETVSMETITNLLSDEGPCVVAARLREHPAIALQQKLLSGLGRVGELKAMPSMFPVHCVVSYTNQEKELTALPTKLDGILVDDKPGRLAFDAALRFDFMREVRSACATVYNTSEDKLKAALAPSVLDALFTKGINYKLDGSMKSCVVESSNGSIEIGKIILNQSVQEAFSNPSEHQGAGLLFELSEEAPIEGS